MAPDTIIVQDETLLGAIDVFAGLSPSGYVLINSTKSLTELGLKESDILKIRSMTVPATQLALEYLGRPVPNAVLLGAFASLTNVISLESVNKAITDRFSAKLAAGNCAAATAAYEFVRAKLKEPTHA
jgi:pyruvate ferredoxin oxidoreductase gamma subunit